MRLRHRLYIFWLDNRAKVEIWMLVLNLVAVPVFLILYWLGVVPYLPFGGAEGECGTGPYKWSC